MTSLYIVGTIGRMDRCDIYCGKLVFKRSSSVPELTTGINYQSSFLSRQRASTSLCYIQLVPIPLLQL